MVGQDLINEGFLSFKGLQCAATRDSIVVQTDDATMVAHKSQAQKIKELVAKLSSTKEYKHLV